MIDDFKMLDRFEIDEITAPAVSIRLGPVAGPTAG
jgi:hypothetical protein